MGKSSSLLLIITFVSYSHSARWSRLDRLQKFVLMHQVSSVFFQVFFLPSLRLSICENIWQGELELMSRFCHFVWFVLTAVAPGRLLKYYEQVKKKQFIVTLLDAGLVVAGLLKNIDASLSSGGGYMKIMITNKSGFTACFVLVSCHLSYHKKNKNKRWFIVLSYADSCLKWLFYMYM